MNIQKNSLRLRKLAYSGLFLALALLLPLLTGQIPEIGSALLPMHLPVLICGFVCGWPWGLAVGFVAPLLRSVLFGMPPMYPVAVSMAFEMAAYGLLIGLLYRRLPKKLPYFYLALALSMIGGRLVWGCARFLMAGLQSSAFPMSAFLSGAVLDAVPGIVIQFLLIPPIVAALQKAKLIPDA